MKTMRRRLGSALAVAALLALCGCNNTESVATRDPGPSNSAPSHREQKAEKRGPSNYCDEHKTDRFTGAAARHFGAGDVMAAYCSMAQMQLELTFVPRLLKSRPPGLRPSEFSRIQDYMTTGARQDWVRKVKAALATKSNDDDEPVLSLMFFDALGVDSDYAFPAGEPVVLNVRCSAADTKVDDSLDYPRLFMAFTVSGDINVVKTGTNRHLSIPVKKHLSLWLTSNTEDESGDIPWLIDGWNANRDVGEPKPR